MQVAKAIKSFAKITPCTSRNHGPAGVRTEKGSRHDRRNPAIAPGDSSLESATAFLSLPPAAFAPDLGVRRRLVRAQGGNLRPVLRHSHLPDRAVVDRGGVDRGQHHGLHPYPFILLDLM